MFVGTRRSLPFEKQYSLGPELWRVPPFTIREATRRSDNQQFVTKVLLKFDHTSHELESIVNELKFWRNVNHPSLVQLSDFFDEDAVLYVLYDYPPGGDLATLMLEKSRIFTEGFARIIAHKMLEALVFMHANGIVHGGCLPQNIMFMVPKGTHGWVNSCKLGFFYRTEDPYNIDEPPSFFTDLKDLAYCLTCLLRKKAGLVERRGFDPFANSFFRSAKDFNHLTDLCYSFIDSIWNADFDHCSAEKLRDHLWLKEHPDALLYSTVGLTENAWGIKQGGKVLGENKLSGWLDYKFARRSCYGMRVWSKAFCVLVNHTIFFYSDESMTVHLGSLPSALSLDDKSVCSSSHSRHPATIALANTSGEVFIWLRFAHSQDYDQWKSLLIEACEIASAKQQDVEEQDKIGADTHAQGLEDAFDDESAEVAQKEESRMNLELLNVQELKSLMIEHSISIKGCIDRDDMIENIIASEKWHKKSPMTSPIENLGRDDTFNVSRDILTNHIDTVHNQARNFSVHLEVQSHLLSCEGSNCSGLANIMLPHANCYDGLDSVDCFVPLPSLHNIKVHPCLHWESRAQELALVLATGVPVNAPVLPGSIWFIIDSSWYRQWSIFVTSRRRMSSPGPINNMWMVNPRTGRPFSQLIEELDTKKGDFRRVTPQIWVMFEKWYGGGPRIFTTDPPIEDSRRWKVEYSSCPEYALQGLNSFRKVHRDVKIKGSGFVEFERPDDKLKENQFETVFPKSIGGHDFEKGLVSSSITISPVNESSEDPRRARSSLRQIITPSDPPFVPKNKTHPLIHEISETLASVSASNIKNNTTQDIDIIPGSVRGENNVPGSRRFSELWEELFVDDSNTALTVTPTTMKENSLVDSTVFPSNNDTTSLSYGEIYDSKDIIPCSNPAYSTSTTNRSESQKIPLGFNSFNPFDEEDGILSSSLVQTSKPFDINSFNPFDDEDGILSYTSGGVTNEKKVHDPLDGPCSVGVHQIIKRMPKENSSLDPFALNIKSKVSNHNISISVEESVLSPRHEKIMEQENLIRSLQAELEFLKSQNDSSKKSISDSHMMSNGNSVHRIGEEADFDTNSICSDDSFSTVDDLNYLNLSSTSCHVVSEAMLHERSKGLQDFSSPHDFNGDSLASGSFPYTKILTSCTSTPPYFSDTSQEILSPYFVHKKTRNPMPPRAKRDFLPLNVFTLANKK